MSSVSTCSSSPSSMTSSPRASTAPAPAPAPTITPALLGAYDPRYMRLHMTAPALNLAGASPLIAPAALAPAASTSAAAVAGSTAGGSTGASSGIGLDFHQADPFLANLVDGPSAGVTGSGSSSFGLAGGAGGVPFPPTQRATSALGRYTQPQRRPNSIASSSPPSPTGGFPTALPLGQTLSQHFGGGGSGTGGREGAISGGSTGPSSMGALRHHGSGSGLGLTLSGATSSNVAATVAVNANAGTAYSSLGHGGLPSNAPGAAFTTAAVASAAGLPNFVPSSSQWEQVSRKLMPLFQHQRIRGSIEEINDLVNAHIDQVIQRGPARALDALSRDCSALVSNGMQAIGAKLVPLAQQISLTARQVHAHRQQMQRYHQQQQNGGSHGTAVQPSPSSTYEQHYVALANRLLERLREQWTYVYTTVLPFLEGALLPLQTNPVLVSLTARGGATYKVPPAGLASAMMGGGTGGDTSTGSYHDAAMLGSQASGSSMTGQGLRHMPSSSSLAQASSTAHTSNIGPGMVSGPGPSSSHFRRQSGGNAANGIGPNGTTTSAFRTQKIDVRYIVLECFRNTCLVALSGICVQSTPSVALGLSAGTDFESLCGEGGEGPGGGGTGSDGGLLRAFLREVSSDVGVSNGGATTSTTVDLGPQLRLVQAASLQGRSGKVGNGSKSKKRPTSTGFATNAGNTSTSSRAMRTAPTGLGSAGPRAELPLTTKTSPATSTRPLRSATGAGTGPALSKAGYVHSHLGPSTAATSGSGPGGAASITRTVDEESSSLNAGLRQMKAVLCSIRLEPPSRSHHLPGFVSG